MEWGGIDIWKMKNKKITGLFWHVHHDVLCEYCYDYQERVDNIRKHKPKHEVEARLRLFRKVKGKLPKKLVEAYDKWYKAREEWYKACEEWNKACEEWYEAYEKWDRAYEKWGEAYEKWDRAYEKYLPEIEKLHAKECGCREWNGEEIVFE
jgi:predicted DsbA family dithiol-disulfide isomerase